MKREIKFRYKVKGENKLIYDSDVNFEYLQQKRKMFGYNGNIKSVESEMQFTGLKDKNGVDIYEGDVVKIVDLDCDSEMWTEYYNGLIGSITFDYKGVGLVDNNYCFLEHWNDGGHSLGFSNFYNEDHVEIVGNIHETT